MAVKTPSGNDGETVRKILSRLTMSPIFFGAIAGCLAVAVQLSLMPGRNAYGLCTVCHTRDALAWVAGKAGGMEWLRGFAQSGWPVFTTVGLFLGALAASLRHGEFRRVAASRPLRMLALGCLVTLVGLVVMSCPTRLFLRLSYADPYAPLALAGLVAGIAAATAVVRRW